MHWSRCATRSSGLTCPIASSIRRCTRGMTASAASTRRFATWESYVWEPEQLIEAGPDVVALLRSTGRGRGSGVEVERETAMVWSVREGRAMGMRFFRHRGEALRASGLDDDREPASPTNGA